MQVPPRLTLALGDQFELAVPQGEQARSEPGHQFLARNLLPKHLKGCLGSGSARAEISAWEAFSSRKQKSTSLKGNTYLTHSDRTSILKRHHEEGKHKPQTDRILIDSDREFIGKV